MKTEHTASLCMRKGVDLITQDVSCGYAMLEMFAGWSGDDSITEESLYDEYGKVVTSTGKSFLEQMNLHFPQYITTMNKYMTNSELIEAVYASLQEVFRFRVSGRRFMRIRGLCTIRLSSEWIS